MVSNKALKSILCNSCVHRDESRTAEKNLMIYLSLSGKRMRGRKGTRCSASNSRSQIREEAYKKEIEGCSQCGMKDIRRA